MPPPAGAEEEYGPLHTSSCSIQATLSIFWRALDAPLALSAMSNVKVHVTGLSADEVPVALIFVAMAALALLAPAQPDTWTHLRTGREIWTTGALITTERFSFTSAGVPWHNHEWLSQLIFFGAYSLGGPVLLSLLTAGCAFAAVLMTWRTMRGGFESKLLLLALLVILLPSGWAPRPQALSLLLFVVALQLAIRDRLEWLVPMMIVWANAHGVVVFGALIALGAAFDSVVWSHDRRRRAIGIAALCMAAPLLSPLGWHYWPRVVQTVSESRLVGIQEFRSGFEMAALPFWVLFAALGVMVARRLRTLGRLEKPDRQMAMLALVLGVASVMSIRNAPLFALVAVPAVSRLMSKSVHRVNVRAGGTGATILVVLAIAAAAVIVGRAWQDGGARLGWRPISPMAVHAIRTCPEPMFNAYFAGGTLLWFVPEQRVFIDGRVEVYPVSLLERSRRADLFADYQELFSEYRIRCAVVPTDSPMALALRRDPSAEHAYSDLQWEVFNIQPGVH